MGLPTCGMWKNIYQELDPVGLFEDDVREKVYERYFAACLEVRHRKLRPKVACLLSRELSEPQTSVLVTVGHFPYMYRGRYMRSHSPWHECSRVFQVNRTGRLRVEGE